MYTETHSESYTMSNPKEHIPAKADLKGKSIMEIQGAILALMVMAKSATFDMDSAYCFMIDDGVGIVDFSEEGLEFSPDGYDERDAIAGVGIDIEDGNLLVMTSDSEDTKNYLDPEDCPIKRGDWMKVYNTLHEILTKANIYA